MCTIGIVYSKLMMAVFKQCDLETDTDFYEPKINYNKNIKYLSFEREGINGPWCGINNYGVCFVASDAYLKNKSYTTNFSVFDAYLDIISQFKTAKEANEHMKKFYSKFINPDILLIADRNECYYIETYNKEVVSVKFTPDSKNKFFAATNHFRFIHGGVEFDENHSTYLRLRRAEEILNKNCSIYGISQVLCDQYYGDSVLSICRSKEICPLGEVSYNTQATTIFMIDNIRSEINCSYQINGNPAKNNFTTINDIFS